MKAKVFLLAAFLIIGTTAFSQKLIDTKKVPDIVKRTFKKKASRATDVKWFEVNRQHYIAKYKMNGMDAEIHIDGEGKMTLQKTKMDPKKLPTAVQKDLMKNHKKKKIYECYMVVKSRKDKYYSVILHEKQGRKKPPLVYEVQYTLQGKYITTYEPDVEPEDFAETGPTKFDKKLDEDIEELKETARDEKVKRKDLPTKTEEYLRANFNHEYRAKEIWLKKNTKYGQYYYIIMKKQGEKKEYILLFDMYGKLLKRKERAV